MRDIPDALQAKLEGGVTTLCWCWRVERRDGAVFGFTSHDRDLSFDGADYRAQGGFEPGDIRRELGLSVDAGSVLGALSDDAINEADVAAGLWDEAAVTVFRVDWTEPEHRYAVWRGEIGETRCGTLAFEAELRAPSHRLTQTTGRVYSRRCDADVGDARCGADLDDPAFKASGTVETATGARAFEAAGLAAFVPDWFSRGRVTFTDGGNAGLSFEVEAQAGASLTLRRAPPQGVAEGDAFTVTAGCDKRFATCREKFGNGLNFRGFPHMPGNDALMAGPRAGGTHDGGSRGIGA